MNCIKCTKEFSSNTHLQKRCNKCRVLTCKQCKKEFTPKNFVYKKKYFCSKSCYTEWQKGKVPIVNLLGKNQPFDSLRAKVIRKKRVNFSLSKKTRKKISTSLKGRTRPNYKNRNFGSKLCKHHIDLDTKNNEKSNMFVLTNSKHASLHKRGYHYLVKTGQIHDYIKWFKKNIL